MSRVLALVLGLLVSSLLSALPAVGDEDPRRSLTMARPEPVGRQQVLLQGRVSSDRGSVVLQRSADGRWVKVRSVPVVRHGYQVTVRTRPREQRFRVRAGTQVSQVRVVKASRPTAKQDACGPRPRKADGSRWSCTFVDDFDAERLDRSRWMPHTNFTTGPRSGNYACYRDDPDHVSVARGTLRLTVRRLPQAVACGGSNGSSEYVSGMVSTYHRFSQQNGRFEARFKNTATRDRGLQEVFWMWPDDRHGAPVRWPVTGEIDVVETYSQYPDLAIPFLHYSVGGPRPGVNTAWDCVAHRGVFNTYTLEWVGDRMEIFVNGKSCLVNTSGSSAFKRRYILALTQGLGAGRNQYVGAAPLPAAMTVDYVRVWR